MCGHSAKAHDEEKQWEFMQRIRKTLYIRGSDTCPVTSLEGAIGVLLYGIFALEQTRGEGVGVV
jgi:hypothetical protein